jgi:hypothetical protein
LDLGYNDRRNAIIYWTVQEGKRTSVTRLNLYECEKFKRFFSFPIHYATKSVYGTVSSMPDLYKQWLHLDASTDRQVMNRPVFVSTI